MNKLKPLFILFCILFTSNKSIAYDLDSVNRIENYLNSIDNLVADFTQISSNGEEATGKFFLSRPGKIRWQYNPPTPTLIIINNNLIAYYDYDLNQVSYVPTENNLASFLTRKNIKFDSDIVIKNFEQESGVIKISLNMKSKDNEGELTLIFNESPIEIRKIEVLDSIGQTTSVILENINNDVALTKELFIIKNPKYFKNERL